MLAAIGVIMVYSSSLSAARGIYGDEYFFIKKHLACLSLGVSALFITWFGLRGRQVGLRKWVYPLTVLGFILLAAVLYSPWGIKVRGAQRWLGWAGYSFQPVELAKVGLLLCSAHLLARAQEKPKTEHYYFIALGLVLLAALFLLIRQPDLGNVLVICILSFILLFLGRVQLIYLASLGFIALSAAILWLARASYVQQRLMAFFDPWRYAKESGFQTIQSFLALGSGGLWGLGLGAGQQKLGALPEAYSDFIMSVIGEEWGLIGSGLILVLFLVFVWAGLKIASQSEDLFVSYLAAGITSLIGVQALFNIWVVTGLFPTKGLPLPFVSYGGTSLVINLMGVGVLLAFASRRQSQAKAIRASGRSVRR